MGGWNRRDQANTAYSLLKVCVRFTSSAPFFSYSHDAAGCTQRNPHLYVNVTNDTQLKSFGSLRTLKADELNIITDLSDLRRYK